MRGLELILLWMILPTINFYLAKQKNRTPWRWIIGAFVLPIISTLILAFWPARKAGDKELLLSFFIILILSSPFIINFAENKLWTEKQAQKIIFALDRYKNDNGHYPTYLADLVPRYLARVPDARILHWGPSYLYKFEYSPGHELNWGPRKEKFDISKHYILDYKPSTVFPFPTETYIPSKKTWVAWD